MSGYSYLEEGVRRRIKLSVRDFLEETAIRFPPINYSAIYDGEHLEKRLFSREEIESQGIISDVHPRNLSLLRGVLLVRDRQVIVIDDEYEKRNNFVLAHEFGHWKLPWHKDLLYSCSEFDLSPKALKQLEREANFFAGEISFLGDLFFDFLRDSQLTLFNIKSLSDTFNMSREATLRRAVELETRPCAALILNLNPGSEEEYLKVKYLVQSVPFVRQIGEINPSNIFPRRHVISRSIDNNESEIEVSLGSNKKRLFGEVWYNGFNVIVLLTPFRDN